MSTAATAAHTPISLPPVRPPLAAVAEETAEELDMEENDVRGRKAKAKSKATPQPESQRAPARPRSPNVGGTSKKRIVSPSRLGSAVTGEATSSNVSQRSAVSWGVGLDFGIDYLID